MSADAQANGSLVGTVVAGRFRVERSLGKGGMAEVFAAIDLATQRTVAVKLLKQEIAQNPEAAERLRREGEVLQKLEHPAIVRLETFGKLEDGRLFIAMEMLSGETLGERIRREGRLEPADAAPILAGACSGLHAAHEKGIIHRDLKPDNVFLVAGVDGPSVKLLDFGISKITGSDKLTQTGEVLGTPRYMAPEQLSAERDIDGRTDVYALGVILYEALAGSPPFLAAGPTDLIVAILHGKHAPLRSFRPDLSPDIEAVVTRAMSRAREARYGSAEELADAFLSVARPSGRVSMPGEARPSMTTAPMGSVGEISGEHPVDVVEPPPKESADDLRPGTFSELAAAPAVIPPPVEAAAEPGPAYGTSAASAAGSTPRRVQEMAAQTDAPVRPRHATPPYELPTTGKRTWLIVGAMLAGAVSAGIAVVALKMTAGDGDAEPAQTASPPADEAPPGAAAGAAAPVAAGPAAGTTAAADGAAGSTEMGGASEENGDADAEDGASADDTGGASTGDPPREKRARRRTRVTSMSPAAPTPAPAAPSAADLMRDARAALRNGDPRACITLVERAMEAGASSAALRLRGDCLARAGDSAGALRAYERFCRLAPDHPAISEVRATVESMGGQCR